MPHLTVEFSSNLASVKNSSVLRQLNQTLLNSKQFDEHDIKSRFLEFDDFCIGTSSAQRGFVHIKLSILSGRSNEIKQMLSESLLATLQKSCDWPSHVQVQLCVEVQEIERNAYAKCIL